MNLQQAIDFPAFHSAHMPSSFYPREAYPGRLDVESRAGDAVIAELRRRGHDVHVQPPWSLGRISAVARRERHALRRRQPARHAGLRRRPVTGKTSDSAACRAGHCTGSPMTVVMGELVSASHYPDV